MRKAMGNHLAIFFHRHDVDWNALVLVQNGMMMTRIWMLCFVNADDVNFHNVQTVLFQPVYSRCTPVLCTHTHNSGFLGSTP